MIPVHIIITEDKRLKCVDWITRTGVSCKWEYHKLFNEWMYIEFVHEEDVVAFKLKFGV